MKISPITRLYIERLSQVEENDTVTYKELQEVSGEDSRPGEKGYPYLQTAIKRLEHEGINFANVPDIGYLRLTPEQAVEQVRQQQLLTGKRAQRHETKILNLDYSRLSHPYRVEQAASIVVAKISKRIFSVRTRERMLTDLRDKKEPVKSIDWDKLADAYMRSKEKK